MRKCIGFAVLLAMASTAVLVTACSESTDLGPIEERIAAIEGGLSAVEEGLSAVEGGDAPLQLPPTERFIDITAVENVGTTETTREDPPDVDPSTISDGFVYKAPGFSESNPNKWEVEAYRWAPGQIVAYQGDTLNLQFFIVQGREHEAWIEGPDGATVMEEITMNRGRLYNHTLTVATPGVYRLICNTHEPSMTAEIVVLPRPSS